MTTSTIAGNDDATDALPYRIGRWLTLTASPVFAMMALLTGIAAPPLALCSAGSDLLPVDGMTAMYLLMSLFHLPPWLRRARPITTGE